MIYLIEAFYEESGFLAFEEELPTGSDKAIKAIMGWTVEQQGWEGYDSRTNSLEPWKNYWGRKSITLLINFSSAAMCK